jgi:hypothetical protein
MTLGGAFILGICLKIRFEVNHDEVCTKSQRTASANS